MLWVASTWISVIVLVLGSALLLFGYLGKESEIVSGNQLNYYVEWSRVLGLILFSAAGLVLALCLILPSFVCQKQCFVFDRSSLDDDVLPPTSINVNFKNHFYSFFFLVLIFFVLIFICSARSK